MFLFLLLTWTDIYIVLMHVEIVYGDWEKIHTQGISEATNAFILSTLILNSWGFPTAWKLHLIFN